MKVKCLICGQRKGHTPKCPMRPGIPVYEAFRFSDERDYPDVTIFDVYGWWTKHLTDQGYDAERILREAEETAGIPRIVGNSQSQVVTEFNISRRHEPHPGTLLLRSGRRVTVKAAVAWEGLEVAAKRNKAKK